MNENCSNSECPGGNPSKISVMVSAICRPMWTRSSNKPGLIDGRAEARIFRQVAAAEIIRGGHAEEQVFGDAWIGR